MNAKHLAKNLKVSVKDFYNLDQIISRSEAKPVEGNFPQYNEIMAPALAREDDVKIKINGKMLAELVELAAQVNAFNQVELSIPLEKGLPIIVNAVSSEKSGNTQSVRGIIMPMMR